MDINRYHTQKSIWWGKTKTQSKPASARPDAKWFHTGIRMYCEAGQRIKWGEQTRSKCMVLWFGLQCYLAPEQSDRRTYPHYPGSLQENLTTFHARLLLPDFEGGLGVLHGQIHLLLSRAWKSGNHPAWEGHRKPNEPGSGRAAQYCSRISAIRSPLLCPSSSPALFGGGGGRGGIAEISSC